MSNNGTNVGLFVLPQEFPCGEGSACCGPVGQTPEEISALQGEVGVDIADHASKHLEEFAGQSFDLVVTVCDNARAACPAFPGAKAVLYWPFDDPASATGSDEDVLDEFRRVRDEIKAAIVHRLVS